MGFSLELFFKELQTILAMADTNINKVAKLKNCIEKGERYAQDCLMIPKTPRIDMKLFMPELLDIDLFYVFDTETTGFAKDAEICQLGVIDNTFTTKIDDLVKITCEMPKAAYDIHHISKEECTDFGYAWSVHWEKFCMLTEDKHLVAWNLSYDLRLLKQTCDIHGVDYALFQPAGIHCAMKAYANHFDISRGREKLITACENHGIEVENNHNAIVDCILTMRVINNVWHQ